MSKVENKYPQTVKDERGREWTINLTIPIVSQFCKENHILMEGFMPDRMDIGQLCDLAFAGTRNQARAEGQTKEEFLEAFEGPSFTILQDRVVNAIINFTRRTIPKAARERLDSLMSTAISAAAKKRGNGETSGDSAPTQESTPAEQDAVSENSQNSQAQDTNPE